MSDELDDGLRKVGDAHERRTEGLLFDALLPHRAAWRAEAEARQAAYSDELRRDAERGQVLADAAEAKRQRKNARRLKNRPPSAT